MTLRQENLYMFQDAGRDLGFEDTMRPEKIASVKSHQSSNIDSSSTLRQGDISRRQPQSTTADPQNAYSQHAALGGQAAPSTSNNGEAWKSFFNSLAPDTLQQLYDMVERNEAKEINSIRNEFEPKLAPILEGISYKRQFFSSQSQ